MSMAWLTSEQLLRILRSGNLADGRSTRGVVVVTDDRLSWRSGDCERFVDALIPLSLDHINSWLSTSIRAHSGAPSVCMLAPSFHHTNRARGLW